MGKERKIIMANFFFRQPKYCMTNPRKAWKTKKAMDEYRKAHPFCEFTGRPNVHVHHIQPIAYRPDLAAEPSNFISLAGKRVHLTVGHAGNYKDYVENVREICDSARIGKRAKD